MFSTYPYSLKQTVKDTRSQIIKMQIWGDNTVNGENKRAAPLTNWMKETKTQQ